MTIATVSTERAALAGFTAVRGDIAAALAATRLAITKRSTPLMSGLLVTTDGASATFAAISDETAVRVTIPASGTEGRWLLPHGSAREVLAAAAKGETKRVADAMPVSFSSHTETGEPIVTAAGFTIPLSNVLNEQIDEFPEFPSTPSVVASVDRAEFAAAVNRVLVAAGADALLPSLMHVNMVVEAGHLYLETTDRYRLAIASVPAIGVTTDARALIPATLLADALKHLTDDRIHLHVGSADGKTRAALSDESVEVSTDVDGTYDFPKVRGLVRNDYPVTATVSAAALQRAAAKATAFSKALDSSGAVAVTFSSGGVTVAPNAPDATAGVSAPEVEGTVHGLNDGERAVTGFAARFLMEALGSFDGEVTLHLREVRSPTLLTEPGASPADPTAFKHLLMPRILL